MLAAADRQMQPVAMAELSTTGQHVWIMNENLTGLQALQHALDECQQTSTSKLHCDLPTSARAPDHSLEHLGHSHP
eukprot:scaffold151717_cov18-Tisochrysis_lutea.AAC.2